NRTREMASRCCVEMGTAGYYRTLSRLTDDPVLTEITKRIAEDEVSHYKHFYRYLKKYQAREGESRPGIARALWNRLRMTDGADSRMGMAHIFRPRPPGKSFGGGRYRRFRRASRPMVQPLFPYRMCVQMLLKPLRLGPRAHRIALPVFE